MVSYSSLILVWMKFRRMSSCFIESLSLSLSRWSLSICCLRSSFSWLNCFLNISSCSVMYKFEIWFWISSIFWCIRENFAGYWSFSISSWTVVLVSAGGSRNDVFSKSSTYEITLAFCGVTWLWTFYGVTLIAHSFLSWGTNMLRVLFPARTFRLS